MTSIKLIRLRANYEAACLRLTEAEQAVGKLYTLETIPHQLWVAACSARAKKMKAGIALRKELTQYGLPDETT
jgi:hypothetical protein